MTTPTDMPVEPEGSIPEGEEIAGAMRLLEQARSRFDAGDYGAAHELLSRAMEIATDVDAVAALWQIHAALSANSAATGDYDSAIEHLKLSHDIHEEATAAEAEMEVQRLQAEYDVEAARREAEIHRLRNVELAHAMEELKSTRNRLIQAERMVSLGSLTAGVAHEINNPVNFIKTGAAPLRRDFEELAAFLEASVRRPEESAEEHRGRISTEIASRDIAYIVEEIDQLLAGMDSGIRRTREIIEGLGLFATDSSGERERLIVDDQVDDAIEEVKAMAAERIRFVRHQRRDLAIIGSGAEIRRLLVNILTNAVQAIDAAGTIAITTSLTEPATVRISITDTGHGIPRAIERRIFEPFFTTREVGSGVGLGLSIAYAIAARHDGGIAVESQPGNGSTFTISLPAVI